MTDRRLAWPLVISAFVTLAGFIGTEMMSMQTWAEVLSVPFVGKSLLQIATVVAATWGGKLMPQPPTTEIKWPS